MRNGLWFLAGKDESEGGIFLELNDLHPLLHFLRVVRLTESLAVRFLVLCVEHQGTLPTLVKL